MFSLSSVIGIAALGGAVVIGSLVTTWVLDEEEETRNLFVNSISPPPPPAARRLSDLSTNAGYRGVAATMRAAPSASFKAF